MIVLNVSAHTILILARLDAYSVLRFHNAPFVTLSQETAQHAWLDTILIQAQSDAYFAPLSQIVLLVQEQLETVQPAYQGFTQTQTLKAA